MVKSGSVPPEAVVKLNATLVKFPAVNPADDNSAAVYNNWVLAGVAFPARIGEPFCMVVVCVPIVATPGPPLPLAAVSVLFEPAQIVSGLAETDVISGFGFTVTARDVVALQLLASVTVTLYVVDVVDVTVTIGLIPKPLSH